jgi:sortase A
MLNPLFPSEQDDDTDKDAGVDPFRSAGAKRHGKSIKPLHDLNPVANVVREKIAKLYDEEPAAKQELLEAKAEAPHLSKHQRFMLDLSKSGKSLAEIQAAWHDYYLNLPDKEKHEVWQEFYQANGRTAPVEQAAPSAVQEDVVDHKMEYEAMHEKGKAVVSEHETTPAHHKPTDKRTVADIKKQLRKHASAGGKLQAKHHIQSLLFGLGIGALAVLIALFSFFNEYIIAPFIQPSRTVSATPLIVDANSVAPSSTPEVIIPKINVEIPLNFSVGTTDENQIENALEDGVVHYPTTVLPGQKGNTAFFGHSSNNIFNPGHYKFAFALLHDLVPGDTFYLTYGGKVYAYQVYDKQIVDPSNVSVLDNVPGKVATATLITCDPPGTSLHRLVIWGEQVSPNPEGNHAGSNTSSDLTSGTQLPSNGPSLWDRFIGGLTGLF